KHAAIGRRVAVLNEVLKLAGVARNVIDDQVGGDVVGFTQRRDIAPRPDARVDRRMVNGVEAGVRAIYRIKEGQNVHTTHDAVERAVQHALKVVQMTAAQTVGIGDEVNAITHQQVLWMTVVSG